MTAASFVADLHIHSPYAFACSKQLTLDNLAAWARRKGIDLLSTGDFTHPAWLANLQSSLVADPDGLYRYGDARFVPGTEISCVYRQDGRVRRVHLLVFLPTLAAAATFSQQLDRHGNLENDGRPTVRLSARDLTALALDITPEARVIPAHVWTPWYGLYGSKGGFDSLVECFGDLSPHITAVESGLSSDPAMNRAVSELDHRAVLSFSDAHSPGRLGREATALSAPLSWPGVSDALRDGSVAYTVEFYPEEGKYHYSGHRKCGIAIGPAELERQGTQCPVCGKSLTLGVLHRVTGLSDNPLRHNLEPDDAGFISIDGGYPPFARLIPLPEIIAAVLGIGVNTRAVSRQYTSITDRLGSELNALLWAAGDDLAAAAGEPIAQAILKSRSGQVSISPGYDGQYGSLSLSPD